MLADGANSSVFVHHERFDGRQVQGDHFLPRRSGIRTEGSVGFRAALLTEKTLGSFVGAE
jgi:hypothetical protein